MPLLLIETEQEVYIFIDKGMAMNQRMKFLSPTPDAWEMND
jgi:hypothetical protein